MHGIIEFLFLFLFLFFFSYHTIVIIRRRFSSYGGGDTEIVQFGLTKLPKAPSSSSRGGRDFYSLLE
ncbi:hypothetical protein BDV39DRAFT_180319, partial [Aspergillus sergii]